MKTVFLLIVLIWSFAISAQHDLGLGIDLGASRIYSPEKHKGIEYKFFPSANLGAYYRFKPEESKSNFCVELMISQIEGKLYSENDVIDMNFNVVGKKISYTYYHITNVSLPVYYGLQFQKIGLLFGAEIALPIYSAYNSRSESSYNDVNETTIYKGSPLYIDAFNFNGRFGFEWLATNKLLLKMSYSHGINIITKQDGLLWKTQQISIGLRYSLMKKQKE